MVGAISIGIPYAPATTRPKSFAPLASTSRTSSAVDASGAWSTDLVNFIQSYPRVKPRAESRLRMSPGCADGVTHR